MSAKLPEDKLNKYISLVEFVLDQNYCTLRDMQSAVGRLQWASMVIVPGRPFIRRLIDKMKYLSKPYHRITLSDEVKQDLALWLTFFQHYNGKTLFLTKDIILDTDINLYSDASDVACGAIFGTHWFIIPFDAV